jgi:hypothetical protein
MGYSSGRYNSSLNTPPTQVSFYTLLSRKETHPRMAMIRVRKRIHRNDGDSPRWERQRFQVESRTLDARSPDDVKRRADGVS